MECAGADVRCVAAGFGGGIGAGNTLKLPRFKAFGLHHELRAEIAEYYIHEVFES